MRGSSLNTSWRVQDGLAEVQYAGEERARRDADELMYAARALCIRGGEEAAMSLWRAGRIAWELHSTGKATMLDAEDVRLLAHLACFSCLGDAVSAVLRSGSELRQPGSCPTSDRQAGLCVMLTMDS